MELTQPNAIGQLPIADGFAQVGIDLGTDSLQLPPSEPSAMSRSEVHRLDQRGDLAHVLLQCEMSGVKRMKFGVGRMPWNVRD
jgi:hypothetical protein